MQRNDSTPEVSMFITCQTQPNELIRKYYFPYSIGVVQKEREIFRRWRPTDSIPLCGDLPEAADAHGANFRLERLGRTSIPVEWIDVAHEWPDQMDVKLDTRSGNVADGESWYKIQWELFERILSRNFCLEIIQ